VRQNVYLDGDPGGPWLGHMPTEVGCIWRGPTQGEVITRGPGEIARFLGWLREHGEPGVTPVDAAAVKAHVVEVRQVPGLGRPGGPVGLFGPDRQPATDKDIETAVRRFGYARRDLLEVVAGLEPEVLDWPPPSRLSVEQAGQAVPRPTAPSRTVRRHLEHLAESQARYLSRLLEPDAVRAALPEPWPKDTFSRLEWVADRAVGLVLELPRRLRSGVFRAPDSGEEWTARKLLRRLVEHEREHVEAVARIAELRRRT